MKSTKIIIPVVFFVLITNSMVSENFIEVQAQTEGNFRLDQINWQGSRVPGATNVPIQFQVINLHNTTLKAIFGVLMLNFPFTDATDGNSNATAMGESLSIYFNVSTSAVVAGDPFELTFYLNIDENAIKGFYSANLSLNFLLHSSGGWSLGAPVIFDVQLELPNTLPEIEWVRPTGVTLDVEPRQEINFTVICSDDDNDSLTYSWEVDSTPVNITEPSFLFTSQENAGIQEIVVQISDDDSTILRTWLVETQVSSETSLDINTQYLEAGMTSEFFTTITNNLWKGKVDIEIQIPPPLIIFNNSSWSFMNITEGETITLPIKIFTPQTAMGGTGEASFSIQFSDQHGTNYFETITRGLIIHGRVQVSVFSSEISLTSVNQGDNVVVSATLLNTGNTNALFVNASLESKDDIFVETGSGKSYLGELEPDSPLPFSVSRTVNSSAPIGNHQIMCVVYYQDDLYEIHKLMINYTISIVNYSQTTSTSTNIDLFSLFIGSGITLLLGGGTIVTIGFVLYRRRSVK